MADTELGVPRLPRRPVLLSPTLAPSSSFPSREFDFAASPRHCSALAMSSSTRPHTTSPLVASRKHRALTQCTIACPPRGLSTSFCRGMVTLTGLSAKNVSAFGSEHSQSKRLPLGMHCAIDGADASRSRHVGAFDGNSCVEQHASVAATSHASDSKETPVHLTAAPSAKRRRIRGKCSPS